MPTPFRFDRAWEFALAPDDLWATLEQTHRYPEWWPWLRDFTLDGDGLGDGSRARLVIQAPLPYQLRCRIAVTESLPARRLVTEVSGDLLGPARLELHPAPAGTVARLAWSLEVRSPRLRPLATVVRPALAWAHDRIVESGLRQFEQHALRDRDAR